MTPETIALKLTDAQRRAILNAGPGYNDDDGLDSSGRRMLYRLIERGLFCRKTVFMRGNPPDIIITPLGIQVRDYLEKGCG